MRRSSPALGPVLALMAGLAGGCADYEVLEVDGVRRQYLEYVPDESPPEGGWPVVLAFHGAYSTPSQMEDYTDLDAVADEEGFIVVYPKGKLRLWNDGRIRDLYDDVAFTDALLDRLADDYPVDPARIYATGISNGGFMSHRLACDLGHRFAAIAPVAGTLSEELVQDCDPARPMAVLVIMGTDDDLVPYEGGELGGRLGNGNFGTMLSAEETAAHWAALSGCEPDPDETERNEEEDGTRLRTRTYDECAARRSVVLHSVVGGGHTWPGARHVRGLGKVSRELDASRAIWAFFRDHPAARDVGDP